MSTNVEDIIMQVDTPVIVPKGRTTRTVENHGFVRVADLDQKNRRSYKIEGTTLTIWNSNGLAFSIERNDPEAFIRNLISSHNLDLDKI